MQGAVYRRRQIHSARGKGERVIERAILPALQSRYKALARELRRGNLRKRLLRNNGQLLKQDDPSTWDTWEIYFTELLTNALTDSAGYVWDAEQRYFISNGLSPYRIDYQDVISRYQMRMPRNISNIAERTERDVNKKIADWFNTDRGLPDLIRDLEQYFSPSRAELVATTEMAYVSSTIADMMMGEYGIQRWQWDAFEDGVTCPTCFELMAQSKANPFYRGDPMPPDISHPRCRCGVYFIGVDVKV